MAPRVKTSERIVQTSLELFNQQGERSVSTNHIAAHMEISPGNLYYHFPNKQAIIAVLFSEYESLVDSFLRPPQGRAATVEDKRYYLKELLSDLEIGLIRQALEMQDGVVARAADMLGMRRTTLVEKMKKYGMTARDM